MNDKHTMKRALTKAGRSDHLFAGARIQETHVGHTIIVADGTAYCWTDLLFLPQFAKALWGDEVCEIGLLTKNHRHEYGYAWEYHLQQMATIEPEDRMMYLEDRL
jgi:hypothetical protein